MVPILNTERLALRPAQKGDENLLYPYMKDPDIYRYMAWGPHKDITTTRVMVNDWITREKEETFITYLLFENTRDDNSADSLLPADQFRGIFSIINIKRCHRLLTYNSAEIAYWLASGHNGKGLMTEAAKRAIVYGFKEIGLNKFTVAHVGENQKSQSLINRLGFRKVGVLKNAFKKENHWFDQHLYELLKKDCKYFPSI